MDLKSFRVLVTATSYGKTNPRLKTDLEQKVGEVIYNTTGRPLSSADLQKLLPGIDGYIAGLDTIDREALQTADSLKVISRYGVGVDNVDLTTAREKRIAVTNTPGANSASVAELTIGLILSLARHIPESVAATREGGWPRLAGVTLEGKRISLLGFGQVGKQVARRLSGFDCRVAAYDPFVEPAFASAHGVELLPFEQVVAEADFLSLHLPLLPETIGMVNRDFLNRMKPTTYLINTSRGELIDDQALAEALVAGRLAGAALDVFSQEPPLSDHPLLKLHQVLVTPHSASHTDGAMNTMGRMALHDCLSVLSGQKPQHPVT